MTPYLNYSGKSSVESYSVEENSITVKFKNNQMNYTYSAFQNGNHIAEMKRLAKSGSGLGGYIAKNKKELAFTKHY